MRTRRAKRECSQVGVTPYSQALLVTSTGNKVLEKNLQKVLEKNIQTVLEKNLQEVLDKDIQKVLKKVLEKNLLKNILIGS